MRLIKSGRWKTPEDSKMRSIIPFLKDPVDFLPSIEDIALESQGLLADYKTTATVFHEYRGSAGVDEALPWRDVDRSILIAVNREMGADAGIALDYRTGNEDPSVLASDWGTEDGTHHWRKVCDSFSDFVKVLEID